MCFFAKNGKIRVDAPTIARFFSDGSPDITPFSGWLNFQRENILVKIVTILLQNIIR